MSHTKTYSRILKTWMVYSLITSQLLQVAHAGLFASIEQVNNDDASILRTTQPLNKFTYLGQGGWQTVLPANLNDPQQHPQGNRLPAHYAYTIPGLNPAQITSAKVLFEHNSPLYAQQNIIDGILFNQNIINELRQPIFHETIQVQAQNNQRIRFDFNNNLLSSLSASFKVSPHDNQQNVDYRLLNGLFYRQDNDGRLEARPNVHLDQNRQIDTKKRRIIEQQLANAQAGQWPIQMEHQRANVLSANFRVRGDLKKWVLNDVVYYNTTAHDPDQHVNRILASSIYVNAVIRTNNVVNGLGNNNLINTQSKNIHHANEEFPHVDDEDNDEVNNHHGEKQGGMKKSKPSSLSQHNVAAKDSLTKKYFKKAKKYFIKAKNLLQPEYYKKALKSLKRVEKDDLNNENVLLLRYFIEINKRIFDDKIKDDKIKKVKHYVDQYLGKTWSEENFRNSGISQSDITNFFLYLLNNREVSTNYVSKLEEKLNYLKDNDSNTYARCLGALIRSDHHEHKKTKDLGSREKYEKYNTDLYELMGSKGLELEYNIAVHSDLTLLNDSTNFVDRKKIADRLHTTLEEHEHDLHPNKKLAALTALVNATQGKEGQDNFIKELDLLVSNKDLSLDIDKKVAALTALVNATQGKGERDNYIKELGSLVRNNKCLDLGKKVAALTALVNATQGKKEEGRFADNLWDVLRDSKDPKKCSQGYIAILHAYNTFQCKMHSYDRTYPNLGCNRCYVQEYRQTSSLNKLFQLGEENEFLRDSVKNILKNQTEFLKRNYNRKSRDARYEDKSRDARYEERGDMLDKGGYMNSMNEKVQKWDSNHNQNNLHNNKK